MQLRDIINEEIKVQHPELYINTVDLIEWWSETDTPVQPLETVSSSVKAKSTDRPVEPVPKAKWQPFTKRRA